MISVFTPIKGYKILHVPLRDVMHLILTFKGSFEDFTLEQK